MDTHPCPKCNEPMDEGTVSVSDQIGYVVQKTDRDAQNRDEGQPGIGVPELRLCGNVSRPERVEVKDIVITGV